MAKVLVSKSDVSQALACVDKAISGTGKLKAGFRQSGLFRREFAEQQYRKYLKAGGKPGDWESFLKWLIENLPAIIAALMVLF